MTWGRKRRKASRHRPELSRPTAWRFRRLWGCAVLAATCLGPACGTQGSRQGPAAASKNHESRARKLPTRAGNPHWLLNPDAVTPDLDLVDTTGVRRLMYRGLRVLDWPDGTIEMAPQALPSNDVAPTPLPDRLHGGYLFSTDDGGDTSIWIADTWVGSARPLATLTERVADLVPGFDRLYVQLLHSNELFALDLDSGKLIDKGPIPQGHSYSSVAFVDGWFAALQTDVRGGLATFDAGATWHALGIEGQVSVDLDSGGVLIDDGEKRWLLDDHGELRPHASDDAKTLFERYNAGTRTSAAADETPDDRARGIDHPLGPRPLADAVLHGWPLNDEEAIIATRGSLGRVALTNGKPLSVARNAYPGTAPCQTVRLGDGLGFVCNERGQGTSLHRFEPPLSMPRVASFPSPRQVFPSGNGFLVVRGSCDPRELDRSRLTDEEPESQPYCVVGAHGPIRDLRVQGDVGVERVVALRDGRVAVLIPPRTGGSGKLHLIGDSVEERDLKLPDEAEAALSSGLWAAGVMQLEDEQLGTWLVSDAGYLGLRVGLDGRVDVAPEETRDRGDPHRTVISGPFALEVTASGVGWQSSDYGMHWQKVLLPRGLEPVRPSTSKSVRHPIAGCSTVGCVYPPWIKVGYDEGEDEEPEQFPDAEAPAVVAITPPSYDQWQLQCFATGESERLPGEARTNIQRIERLAPRAGLKVGFGQPHLMAGLVTGSSADLHSGGYRPFWGISGPPSPRSELLMDFGLETPIDFRAYAWGDPGEAWGRTSAWLVRVATRFGSTPLWTTAPTYTPWPDATSAARRFGSDRSHRYSPTWSLVLDADETSGVLKSSISSEAELHLVSEGKPITSIEAAPAGQVKSAAMVRGSLHIGAQEGTRFEVHAVRDGELRVMTSVGVGLGARATVVRSTDSQELGILVHSTRGDWYLYPLDDDYTPSAPLTITRAQLAETPEACTDTPPGWLVVGELPLSSLNPPSRHFPLDLAEPYHRAGASRVSAKVVVTDAGLCLAELAAELSGSPVVGGERPSTPVPASARIPLAAMDPGSSRRLRFRCSR